MKKTLSIILAILMIVTTMPFAFAADDYAVVDTEAGTVTIDGTLGGKTTATEDDIITLLDAIKGYVESGITTIIVTGSDPAIIHLDYGNWVFDMPAVSEALYRLTDEDSRSPYCGTIDLILPDVTEILDDEFNNSDYRISLCGLLDAFINQLDLSNFFRELSNHTDLQKFLDYSILYFREEM